MRSPAVAGKFYPQSETQVREEIERDLTSPLGPGSIPELNKNGPRDIVGAVVPHAGYVFSGPVAAHFYNALAMDGFPETFVIIGPNHYGTGSPVATTTDDFRTPLGTIKTDEDIVGRLGKLIVDDPSSHRMEHSIEVQIPFIQYFSKDAKIVPIAMAAQDYETAMEVADELKHACKGKDVVFIASTDLSHYIPAEEAERKDRMVVEKILALDIPGIYDVVVRQDISMCGYGPTMAMLKASGGNKAELLKHATSGDSMPMSEVVGYAAIKVTR